MQVVIASLTGRKIGDHYVRAAATVEFPDESTAEKSSSAGHEHTAFGPGISSG
jgi:hypothetical protein